MRKFLESWGGPTVVLLAIGTLFWRLDARITAVELRMESRLSAIEARMAAVEAKLDLLIEGLDITVTPRKGEDQ